MCFPNIDISLCLYPLSSTSLEISRKIASGGDFFKKEEVELLLHRSHSFNKHLQAFYKELNAVPGAEETSRNKKNNVIHLSLTFLWDIFPDFTC